METDERKLYRPQLNELAEQINGKKSRTIVAIVSDVYGSQLESE